MARQWTRSEDVLNRLLRRCVECPQNVQPTCPVCASDETCSLKPQECYNCASMVCVQIKSIPGQEAPSNSTPIGAIIGGVAGAVLVIVGVTFLVWHFCYRKRRRQNTWEPPEKSTLGRSEAHLSRTHSIASTVMTRASNVIQIAYIPGVTVRSAPESPEIPPPMPSIPSTYAATSTNTTPDVEQHFFMPKDFRDSVWSDTSSMMTDPRVSIAPSLARASVATTLHPDASVPAVPAQYAYRAQANAVSVRSGSTTPSLQHVDDVAPPMPQIPKTLHMKGSSIVARNVVARPIEVKKAQSSSSLNPLPKKSASRRVTPVPTISDEKEVVMSSPTSTTASESGLSSLTFSAISPSDASMGATSGRPTTAYAEAMIHEAMMRATQDKSHTGPGKKHDSGPFSDVNEIR